MTKKGMYVVPVLWVAAVLALGVAGTAAAGARSSGSVAGTWSGKYGGTYSGKFTLRWHLVGARLVGSIVLSNPGGSYGITGSVGRGGSIKFGVVQVGATYKGTVFGSHMSGSYQTPGGGGSWSAHKVS